MSARRWLRVAATAAALALGVSTIAVFASGGYTFKVVASGLSRPTGIAVGGWKTLYFTEVPTPGVGGGLNGVSSLDLDSGDITVLHQGEPEPVNLALSRDDEIYWTCKSAGVILERRNGQTSVLLDNLDHPTGIALDKSGKNPFFTEVPTPGVSGQNGGYNRVSVLDLKRGHVRVIHSGDPEPTDVAVAPNGTVYWTCTSAGVIVEARPKRKKG